MRNAIFLGFLALSGCASAPGYRSPAVPLPASFREVSDTNRTGASVAPIAERYLAPARRATVGVPADAPSVATGYWDQLGDSTLSRLIGEVRRANPDVQSARARMSAARSDRLRSALDLTPSTSFFASYARQRLSSATYPGATGVFPDQTVWQTGVNGSWDLDVFGGIRNSVRARGALVGVAQEQLRDVEVTLTAELARAYFELRGAQEQLGVAQQNAENQRRTFDFTRQRLEAGRGNAFDTERAQAQLSSTLASIPAREAQVAVAQYRIGALVGRSPAEVARELDPPGKLPPLPDVTSVGNPDAVVRYRPDVAAAERLAAAQGAFVSAAQAGYLPRVTIGASAGFAAPEYNMVGNQGTLLYAVGPVISWSALNLGRVNADVDAAQAREEAARADYDRVVLAAMQDVETSLSSYRAARRRLEQLQNASAASERAAKLARLRFTEGLTDFLQVLDAERTQLATQDQLAQGRMDAATAYAALYKALGGR